MFLYQLCCSHFTGLLFTWACSLVMCSSFSVWRIHIQIVLFSWIIGASSTFACYVLTSSFETSHWFAIERSSSIVKKSKFQLNNIWKKKKINWAIWLLKIVIGHPSFSSCIQKHQYICLFNHATVKILNSAIWLLKSISGHIILVSYLGCAWYRLFYWKLKTL